MRRLMVFALLALAGGLGCEVLLPVDHGRLETETGLELRPAAYPFEVTVDDAMDHPDAVVEAAEAWNEATGLELFVVEVDGARWLELSDLGSAARVGTVIVSQGFVGTPEWVDGLEWEGETGGLAHLQWDPATGLIDHADVVLNSDHAYSRGWVVRASVHELGHTMGLGHDDQSIDLNSCMMPEAIEGCEMTAADLELIVRDYEGRE